MRERSAPPYAVRAATRAALVALGAVLFLGATHETKPAVPVKSPSPSVTR
jgi:hypothetical protein